LKRPPFTSRVRQPSDSPGFLLWKVSNAWQRAIRAALAPFGLTHGQFVLLTTATWYGAERESPLTQAQLAELASVDIMTTSQVVRALEKARLLRRAVLASDTRARAITVTPAGVELVGRAVVAVETADAAFFEPLGARAPAFLGAMQRLMATSVSPDSTAAAPRPATAPAPAARQRRGRAGAR
jgi:MarR family transcriptional regulator, organic hydroperoxide resistance regulator